jgi:hypothetical protein
MAILSQFRNRFWDNSGAPLAGGKVYVYAIIYVKDRI